MGGARLGYGEVSPRCQEAGSGHNGVWELGWAGAGTQAPPPCLPGRQPQKKVSASTLGPPLGTGFPTPPPHPGVLAPCP